MKGIDLDLYLSLGYFRMQQSVFTCRYVVFDSVFSPVFWLRIDLARAELGNRQRTLLKIRNKFSVHVKPFILSEELEMLYASYRNSIDFDAPASVEECLFNGSSANLFDTHSIEIRDDGRLIAVGIFDCGSISIAGIMNFFDPAYRKYSLGKCLMLLKMEHAKSQRMAYYYPGYLASEYPKLNYKLFACEAATEVYDDYTDLWYPFTWERIATMTGGSSERG